MNATPSFLYRDDNNPLLREYMDRLSHQRTFHSVRRPVVDEERPWPVCTECRVSARIRDTGYEGWHDIKKKYSWAVPNPAAVEMISRYSPNGVVEIGAGGGYWAAVLARYGMGVDVIAYDPKPYSTTWTAGKKWHEVLVGDHTAVIGHPERTLLLVWPEYNEDWAAQAVDLYSGDTVIYVGEGPGGCTGNDRLHALLGQPEGCWCDEGLCTCPRVEPIFSEIEHVEIPQWAGVHDELGVYERIKPSPAFPYLQDYQIKETSSSNLLTR